MTVDEYTDLHFHDKLVWFHAGDDGYEFVKAGPIIFGDMAMCLAEDGGSFPIAIERLFLFEFWDSGCAA